MMFTDIFIGMPGRVHDARVFRNSDIYNQIINEDNPLIPQDMHILGDSAYPIMLNVLTPFRDNGHLAADQLNYNYKLSCLRSIIERAFGRLKGKFRRLKYMDVSDPIFGTDIIEVACILHNFIIATDNDDEEFDFEDLPEEPVDEDEDDDLEIENRNQGVQKRRNIVNILRN
jgi:hypothetical protein